MRWRRWDGLEWLRYSPRLKRLLPGLRFQKGVKLDEPLVSVASRLGINRVRGRSRQSLEW
jgi:hypothetical protein